LVNGFEKQNQRILRHAYKNRDDIFILPLKCFSYSYFNLLFEPRKVKEAGT
jgi:hypothetical protein